MQCNSRHQRHCIYSYVRVVLCRRSKSDETRGGSHLAGYCHGKRPVTTDCPITNLISVLFLQRLVFVTSLCL